jgi:zinc/manganese transport system substrate-binding protein
VLKTTRLLPIAAPILLGVLILTGCSPAAPDNASDGELRVVASTNVYGDIASTVGGTDVEVTSVIDDPAQDPHEFEANARVQLALSRADVVVMNGGGYDDFMTTMLSASGNDDAIVIDAVQVSGFDAGEDGFNEHVWYDYPTMAHLATAMAGAFGEVDELTAVDYAQNAAEFARDIDGLMASALQAAADFDAPGAIITEPVPLYLLDAMDIENLTPPEFSEAIEEDTDVPPALLQSVLNLIGDGSAAIVVYNEQTGGPQTDAVIDVATDNQVPAIGVTETLPEGMHYIDWQQSVQLQIIEGLGG